MWDALLQWDGNVLLWIQEHLRIDFLNNFMRFITTLGNAGMIWIGLSVLFLCFKKTRKMGIMCVLALLCSVLLNNIILKPLVNRTRPFVALENLVLLVKRPTDASFPSGHTAASFAVSTVILWCCRIQNKKELGQKKTNQYFFRQVACFLVGCLAILIAFSRLYLGCHYPSDVMVGMVSGIFCGVMGMYIYKLLSKKLMRKT